MAQILAEASLEDSVACVYDELLNSGEGSNSILVVDAPGRLVGGSLAQAQAEMPHAIILGLMRTEEEVTLAPHPGATTIAPGNKLAVIAQSKRAAVSQGAPRPTAPAEPPRVRSRGRSPARPADRPQRVLICGWDALMSVTVEDMRVRAPAGSEITLITDEKPAGFSTGTRNRITTKFAGGMPHAFEDISRVLDRGVDTIVLLPDMVASSDDMEDSLYLATMLCIKRYYKSNPQRPLPRVIGVANNENIKEISQVRKRQRSARLSARTKQR